MNADGHGPHNQVAQPRPMTPADTEMTGPEGESEGEAQAAPPPPPPPSEPEVPPTA